jgi:P27 family predicted phage terminase small subunit
MAKTGRTPNRLVTDAVGSKGAYLKSPYGSTERFKAIWKEIVQDFEPGHFWESDRTILEDYVRTRCKLEQVEAECARTPYIITSETGKESIAPIHDLAVKLSGRLNQMARTLRLAPSTRMQTTQAPKESQWSKRRKSEANERKGAVLGLRLA